MTKIEEISKTKPRFAKNKAGYTATQVACGWAGAIFKASPSFGQEQLGQRPQKPKKK